MRDFFINLILGWQTLKVIAEFIGVIIVVLLVLLVLATSDNRLH